MKFTIFVFDIASRKFVLSCMLIKLYFILKNNALLNARIYISIVLVQFN